MKFLTRILGTFKALFLALFGDKRIIVISDSNVTNYPLTGKLQIATLIALLTFLSWLSYSTGSFVAYKSVLDKKNEEINWANLEKRNMGQQFAMLKRDLLKLSNNTTEIGEYEEFILGQYHKGNTEQSVSPAAIPSIPAMQAGATAAGGITDTDLLDRIDFLENKLISERQSRDMLVDAIQQTTRGKIEQFEKAIQKTGLNIEELKRKASEEDEANNQHQDDKEDSFLNQGGPYVPFDEGAFGKSEQVMLSDLSRLALLDSIMESVPVGVPLPDARITSGYGKRVDPITKRWAAHFGLDFAGKTGQKALSTASGTVKFAGRNGAYGLLVIVDHGLGITTRYGHLRKIYVKEGDRVEVNQPLGEQGSTGRSTGSHLHYEVRYNGKALNPRSFLKAGEYVQK